MIKMDEQVRRIEKIERSQPLLKAKKVKVNELSFAVSNASDSERPLAQNSLDKACTELHTIVNSIVNTDTL